MDLLERELLKELDRIIAGYEKRFAAAIKSFHKLISEMSEPVAHGTSGQYLASILEKGLGGAVPEGASCSGRISVCSLKFKDGLLGAYAFALRRTTRGAGLSIEARKFGGRDVIERYVQSIGFSRSRAFKTKIGLRILGLFHRFKRDRRRDWPILLIYDIEEKTKLQKAKNAIPSDFNARCPLEEEALYLVLAPVRKCQQVQEILASYGAFIPVFPLELLELAEIIEKDKSKKQV